MTHGIHAAKRTPGEWASLGVFVKNHLPISELCGILNIPRIRMVLSKVLTQQSESPERCELSGDSLDKKALRFTGRRVIIGPYQEAGSELKVSTQQNEPPERWASPGVRFGPSCPWCAGQAICISSNRQRLRPATRGSW